MGQDDQKQPLPKQSTQKDQQHSSKSNQDKPDKPPVITDYASL